MNSLLEELDKTILFSSRNKTEKTQKHIFQSRNISGNQNVSDTTINQNNKENAYTTEQNGNP